MLGRNLRKITWLFKNWRKIEPASELIAPFFGSKYPFTYNTDGLVTVNNCDFIKDPKFARAYQLAKDTNPWQGFSLQWRVNVVCYFANLVKNLEGDYVECGVNTGAYSRAVIDYIDFNSTGKAFYLLDTYEGLVEAQLSDEEKKDNRITQYLGHYRNVYDEVVKTFAPFNVYIVKGVVPQSLEQCKTEKICYLSIDMNCVAPEIAAANYFWDKVVRGGVVILDDYGFPMHINQKLAFDEFAKEKGVEILCLPTGQGIMFKQ